MGEGYTLPLVCEKKSSDLKMPYYIVFLFLSIPQIELMMEAAVFNPLDSTAGLVFCNLTSFNLRIQISEG